MNTEHPYLIRFGLLTSALFFLSAFKACSDVQYRLRAQPAIGHVNKIVENKAHGEAIDLHVNYRFLNENSRKLVMHFSAVPLADAGKYSIGQEVPIEYYGSEGFNSRILGSETSAWTWFFVGSLVAAVLLASGLTWQARSFAKRP